MVPNEAIVDPVLDNTAELFITIKRMNFEQFLEATRAGILKVELTKNIQSPTKHT
ncbi:hypothetical protein D3C75_135590 [compost metagenome]